MITYLTVWVQLKSVTQIRCRRAFQESKLHASLVFRFFAPINGNSVGGECGQGAGIWCLRLSPMSGFWSCKATPGSGHLTLTDRSLVFLVSIQTRLPSPFLEAFWKSRCWRKVWSFHLFRYFKLSSKQIMSILRKFLSLSSHLIVKLDWNRIPPWKSKDFLRVTDLTCSDKLSKCYKAFYVSLIL